MPRTSHIPVVAAILPIIAASAFTIAAPASAQRPQAAAPATPPLTAPSTTASSDPLARIRDEGINHSQVMQTLSYLSDVIGPRLTGSPSLRRANAWTAKTMTGWGLSNVHDEAWGPFGRGWSIERFSAQVTEPTDFPLIAYPKAWTPGTKGALSAPVVYFMASKEEDLDAYKGKLKGAIVLNGPMREMPARFQPQGSRYTDAELLEMAQATKDAPRRPRQGAGGPGARGGAGQAAAFRFAARRLEFLYQEGAAVIVDSGGRGDDGTVFVQQGSIPQDPNAGFANRISVWSKEAESKNTIPQLTIAAEQYNRIARMVVAGEPVKMDVDLKVKWYDDDPMVYNTIAEIPGTDKKDEIVMCGGHMDSWHAGTGATDNGAGVAVCMEAMRILKTLNLPMRRTVRVGLWTGEEEGEYGSRAYVAQHFGAMQNGVLTPKPEQAKLAGYFNFDNGTGKIRGIYAQGNDAVVPIFTEWLKPFADLGATTVTIRNTGSTDHVPFDGVDLPGFQFIQDTIEYDSRTHHSNMDVFDRIQGDDLKQSAVLMAAFLYDTAQRDDMLPRKPIPAPVAVGN